MSLGVESWVRGLGGIWIMTLTIVVVVGGDRWW